MFKKPWLPAPWSWLVVCGLFAGVAVSISPAAAQQSQMRIALQDPAAAPAPQSSALPGGMTQEEIDRELNNPVGNLWMLITQGTVEQLTAKNAGSTTVSMIAVEPVLPIHLNANWNLINRPYVPFIFNAPDVAADAVSGRPEFTRGTGVGDFGIASLLSPREPVPFGRLAAKGRIVWGIGPTFQFPTATEPTFGHHKYQAGPAAAIGYLDNDFTVIAFAQQWWSYAGDRRFPGTDYAWVQYVMAYQFSPGWQITTGMPTVQFNWKRNGANAVTFPVGLGWQGRFSSAPCR